jgi:hypothetical protein
MSCGFSDRHDSFRYPTQYVGRVKSLKIVITSTRVKIRLLRQKWRIRDLQGLGWPQLIPLHSFTWHRVRFLALAARRRLDMSYGF